MAYSTTNIEKMINPLIGYKLADDAMIFGVLCCGCRCGVIEKDGELLRITDSCGSHPSKDAENRRSVVVGKCNIRMYFQYLTRPYILLPGVSCEDFLSKCFAHMCLQFVE
jgi:hypothetical protein